MVTTTDGFYAQAAMAVVPAELPEQERRPRCRESFCLRIKDANRVTFCAP